MGQACKSCETKGEAFGDDGVASYSSRSTNTGDRHDADHEGVQQREYRDNRQHQEKKDPSLLVLKGCSGGNQRTMPLFDVTYTACGTTFLDGSSPGGRTPGFGWESQNQSFSSVPMGPRNGDGHSVYEPSPMLFTANKPSFPQSEYTSAMILGASFCAGPLSVERTQPNSPVTPIDAIPASGGMKVIVHRSKRQQRKDDEEAEVAKEEAAANLSGSKEQEQGHSVLEQASNMASNSGSGRSSKKLLSGDSPPPPLAEMSASSETVQSWLSAVNIETGFSRCVFSPTRDGNSTATATGHLPREQSAISLLCHANVSGDHTRSLSYVSAGGGSQQLVSTVSAEMQEEDSKISSGGEEVDPWDPTKFTPGLGSCIHRSTQ